MHRLDALPAGFLQNAFHLSILHPCANEIGYVFIDLDIKPTNAEMIGSCVWSVMRGSDAVVDLFKHERQVAHALAQNRLDMFQAVAPILMIPYRKLLPSCSSCESRVPWEARISIRRPG